MRLRQTVLDTTDPRGLAEFWRQVLGWRYRSGDADPGPRPEWLVLRHPDGGPGLAFQRVEQLTRSTWPDGTVPQQIHLDLTVEDVAELDAEHDRLLALRAELLLDRSDDPEEPLRVYADPEGHPFCVFVA